MIFDNNLRAIELKSTFNVLIEQLLFYLQPFLSKTFK